MTTRAPLYPVGLVLDGRPCLVVGGGRVAARKGKVKGSPLARWTDEQVEQYIADNGVLVNPLVHDGYPSIGCWPCTRRVAPGDDPRSGRWAGTSKTECGIHA